MWDDEFEYVLFDPSPAVEDDNRLFKTTHTCPTTGEYCVPSCAWALIPTNPVEKKMWVCGKAMRYANEDYSAQGVTWDYS